MGWGERARMDMAPDHEIVIEPAQIIDADTVLKLCHLAY